MQRRFVIFEEHGIYQLLSTSGIHAKGPSVRAVFRKVKEAGELGLRDPSIIEIIERALGERPEGDGGQIHTGRMSG